jgi:hypothetical protein
MLDEGRRNSATDSSSILGAEVCRVSASRCKAPSSIPGTVKRIPFKLLLSNEPKVTW